MGFEMGETEHCQLWFHFFLKKKNQKKNQGERMRWKGEKGKMGIHRSVRWEGVLWAIRVEEALSREGGRLRSFRMLSLRKLG